MRLIDADDFVEWLLSDAITDEQRQFAEKVRYAAERMPSVDAVPAIHGKWQTNRLDDAYWVCTVCKKVTRIPRYVGGMLYAYCPHCGARMDGDDNG